MHTYGERLKEYMRTNENDWKGSTRVLSKSRRKDTKSLHRRTRRNVRIKYHEKTKESDNETID